MSEGELVHRAQSGDTDAFSELVLTHQRFVYNLALHCLSDPHEAEDIAQEVFLRAWQALPRFRRQSSFRTWLYRIATNLCYNRLPALKRQFAALGEEVLPDLPSPSFHEPAVRLDVQERREFLHQQIDALPESYRILILLRYQQELLYAEIAEVVGIPLGSVKTGLFRAKARLRAAMCAYEEEPAWTR